MDERIKVLRSLEPSHSGRPSFVAILEAAAGLFGEFPAKDITLRDILSISGVSNQTLYNYFPQGRDDIALTLYDRFQRTVVDYFINNIRSIDFNNINENSEIIDHLSAGLARAAFGLLKETYVLKSAVFEYLRSHHLGPITRHATELEAAMAGELTLRFGDCFSPAELPRIVRLSVCAVRGISEIAMMNKEFPIDELESNARKVIRTLLRTGLRVQEGHSGAHDFLPYDPGPSAIVGAPLSPSKKQGILDRILKRQHRG